MSAARPVPLVDRADAGRRLGAALAEYRGERTVVVAIPRGGVPVAYEVARQLGAPLDVLLVRKIGLPGDPEYGLGAVAEGGVVVLDAPRIRACGLARSDLEPAVRRQRAEVERQAAAFRGGRPPLELQARTVLVVDDGVATGGTVEAAIDAVRARGAGRIVVAVGVAPPEAVRRLRARADGMVAILVPTLLEAVGQWYANFEPVEDAEVQRLLAAAGPRPALRPG